MREKEQHGPDKDEKKKQSERMRKMCEERKKKKRNCGTELFQQFILYN